VTVRSKSYAAAASLVLLLAGCMVGPDYVRPPPDPPAPAQYKELAGWRPAAPADTAPKGNWWAAFHDPLLDQLEPLVQVSNQTVQASYQNYLQALALVRAANASLYPTLGVTGSVTRARGGGSSTGGASSSGASSTGTGATSTSGGSIVNQGSVEGLLSWDLDLWGKVRRTIEENEAKAQASEATLVNATLSAQVALATAVINLRVTDRNIDLLTRTAAAYREFLRIVSNAVRAGYRLYPPSDEISARTQLESTQSSLIALGIARAQYAHAIAVLAGKNPEDLDIPHSTKLPALPQVPVGVPSTLLQRRPDIAAAERTMAAQNAAIGVAVSAYYPDISLSATGGFSQAPLGALFSAANIIWALGVSGAETLIDFGARESQVEAAKAAYESAVATYRATVLGAFQNVEDNLSSLRILEQQAAIADAVVRDATRGAQIARNEYQGGIVDYTTVATAQATQLASEQTALNIQLSQLTNAATLIGNLGGGWSAAQLHDAQHPEKLAAQPAASPPAAAH
jgi:NodT family efflux transporter outer membrane factor (OMF) lipoprotein